MSAIRNPQQAYLESKVLSSTKEELTLMLYEGALKFANQAIIALNANDYAKLNDLVKRVCDIIFEFQLTLDRKYPISKNFDVLYGYIVSLITAGAEERNVKKMEDARDLIRDFRDMWVQAMKAAKTETAKGNAAKH